jgi:hypothetical protein
MLSEASYHNMTVGRIPSVEGGIQPTIVDAKGDLIVATGNDSPNRLAVGANDTVLTADSTAATGLKWATPAAGGMTLISTTTLTGASVTLSSIPSTYKNLQLIIRNALPVTNDDNLCLRFNGDTANRYGANDYSTANSSNVSFGGSLITIGNGIYNVAANGITIINITDYANTTTWKTLDSNSFFTPISATTQSRIWKVFGQYNQTAAISSITLFGELGNFTSGTALLYGVK